MGRALAPDYPFAPDSTVAHWALPQALAPGDSLVVEIDWQARPSTLPRRQGRQGRRFDFAQWYPKVVVYDRYGWEAHALYPGGEFYGEFATFDVTLDLAADQVIGATGVPVEGDPGWEHARANPGEPVDYQRDFYRSPLSAHACGVVAAGRKCVRFYAENVHHFAFSLNPRYVYEQGRYHNVAVHVLYQPQDTASWGHGVAVGRTVAALAWLDTLYGTFAWPQLTNVHRIEGGGTEFPMMVMNGGASLGLIVHEVGHNYTMGILANNEWREGYLDEGFTSFQTGWFFEHHGAGAALPGLDGGLLDLDLDRWSEPVSLVSEQYRDFTTYNIMIYSKGQLFYEELRYVVGDDAMRRILRLYYDRWQLKHVDEAKFRAVCEEVSHQDLGWFFAEWLHATPLFDYRLQRVQRRHLANGGWRTTVTIRRLGDGMMPVEIGDRDTIYARATGQPEEERVEFVTAKKPARLMLDPRGKAHDWNVLNNREPQPFKGRGLTEFRLDNPIRETARRDRLVSAWLPLVWSNTAGGVTLAFRARDNYMSRFDRNVTIGSVATRGGALRRSGLYVRWANPTANFAPRTATSVAAWSVEGRAGVALHVDRSLRQHLDFGPDPHAGFDVEWMATTNLAYLDRRLWDDAGTIEAGPWVSTAVRHGQTEWSGRLSLRWGLVYRYPGVGVVSSHRYDVDGYSRSEIEGRVVFPFARTGRASVRLYGGAYASATPPPLQRRIMLAGADPYETFSNPLLRSAGALFVRPGFHYHASGGPDFRGFAPDLGGRWAVAMNVDATHPLRRFTHGVVREIAITGFADAGVDAGPAALRRHQGAGLAGVGARHVSADHARLGRGQEHRSPRCEPRAGWRPRWRSAPSSACCPSVTSGRRGPRPSWRSSQRARAAAIASTSARCTPSCRRPPGRAWPRGRRCSCPRPRRAWSAPTCRAPTPARPAPWWRRRAAGPASTWASWSSIPSAASRFTAPPAACARAPARWASGRS